MRLKVLGSGSKGNCYVLQGEKETLLLEGGINYKEILKGLDFNISNVSCLISHEHKDHSKALQELLNNGIDVYTGMETAKGQVHYRLKFIKAGEQFNMNEFIILPFDLQHDVPNLGFLIQHPEIGKLIYLTDTYYCKYKFNSLNCIMIECNYSKEILDENLYSGNLIPVLRDRIVESHFSLENVKEFLKANDLSQVKNIVLLHLSDGNSNAEQFKQDIEALTGIPTYIAVKGLEIEL